MAGRARGWLPWRSWVRTPGLPRPPLCLCTLLALAAQLPTTGLGAYVNLTALGRSASVPLSLDDDSAYLRDLYWPSNHSWPAAGFHDADGGHLIGAGVFLPDAGTTGRPPARVATGPPEPEFDSWQETNVTAPLGGSALLRCRVRNLGEHQVSWVRRRDWHILSSGPQVYTSDGRFQVARRDWALRIAYLQARDAGAYVCQVSTDKGLISHYFNLHVVVPTAYILGNGEYHIGEGSTISLVCIIENGELSPHLVQWWHNERPLADAGLHGVSVVTEPGPRTHSRLVVASATRAHSGNYTCTAPDTEPDTINVYVSQGDNTAAIQKQGGPRTFDSSPVALTAVSIATVVLSDLWR